MSSNCGALAKEAEVSISVSTELEVSKACSRYASQGGHAEGCGEMLFLKEVTFQCDVPHYMF